jgi:hypothetical protein
VKAVSETKKKAIAGGGWYGASAIIWLLVSPPIGAVHLQVVVIWASLIRTKGHNWAFPRLSENVKLNFGPLKNYSIDIVNFFFFYSQIYIYFYRVLHFW